MANATPKIDHFCALVQDYKAQDMRQDLADAGITLPANSGFGMIGDPDGLRLQLLNVPGGLAGTIVPGGRISLNPPALHPIGLDHVMLAVSDLDRSATFYQKFFGKDVSPSTRPAHVWFQAGNTKLGLEAAKTGEQPPSIIAACASPVSIRKAQRRNSTNSASNLPHPMTSSYRAFVILTAWSGS